MKIGILKIYPVKGNDWQLLKKAGQKRNHKVETIFLNQMWLEAKGQRVMWKDKKGSLNRFDIILVRGGGKMFRLQRNFLRWFERQGKIVVDKKFIINNITDKTLELSILKENNFLIPDFYIFSSKEILESLIDNLSFPLMLKSKRQHRGEGVYLLKNKEELKKRIDGIKDISDWYLQEVIVFKKDIRVFVVGDKALGAIERIPKRGEYRANISLGGKAKVFKLDKNMEKLAIKASKILNCEISGVDFLLTRDRVYLLEINSIPQFYGFMQATKINVPEKIIEYLEKKFKNQI